MELVAHACITMCHCAHDLVDYFVLLLLRILHVCTYSFWNCTRTSTFAQFEINMRKSLLSCRNKAGQRRHNRYLGITHTMTILSSYIMLRSIQCVRRLSIITFGSGTWPLSSSSQLVVELIIGGLIHVSL